MPIPRAGRTGLTDKVAGISAGIKGVLDGDSDNLYGVRELAKTEAVSRGKLLGGYLVALAIGALWVSDEISIEYRAGKLLAGSK